MSFTRNPKLIYAICAVLWAVIAWNLATRESEAYERVASSDALNSYAKATLRDVQSRSIANNQEYCGVIYEDDQGKLYTSKIYEGDHANCEFDWGVPLGNHVVASFHTHAGYDPEYDLNCHHSLIWPMILMPGSRDLSPRQQDASGILTGKPKRPASCAVQNASAMIRIIGSSRNCPFALAILLKN